MREHPDVSNGSDERRLRVAMVIQRFRPYFAGQGVQVEGLAAALARRGVETTIITAMRDHDAPPRETLDGFSVRRLRSDLPGLPAGALARHLWSPAFALRTAAFLWREHRSFDLVHVHALTDALYAAWLFTRAPRRPLLFEMTLLGTDDPISVRASRNRLPALRYRLYSRCDGYVAISPALAERYREAGLPENRLRVIPQGVDLERFSPAADKGAVRSALGLADGEPLFVFVGSLIERKGIDVLLAAWEGVHAVEPRARLALVGLDRFAGDPEAQRFLDGHLARLSPPARERIVRTGVRDDVAAWLRAADAFLFPSRREGFGTVIAEAMACGVPCVVAAIPGITDFIFGNATADAQATIDGVTDGIVVPQEDPEALARAALALSGEGKRAAAIGRAARARVETTFGFDTVAARYLDTYRNLLHGTRG